MRKQRPIFCVELIGRLCSLIDQQTLDLFPTIDVSEILLLLLINFTIKIMLRVLTKTRPVVVELLRFNKVEGSFPDVGYRGKMSTCASIEQ
jgi:hypothetical protein